MPIHVRTATFTVRSVRVFYEDLLRVHQVIDKAAREASSSTHRALIRVNFRETGRNRLLANPEELKSYTPADLDHIVISGIGEGFTVDNKDQKVYVGLSGHVAMPLIADLADIVQGLPSLPAPGRLAYLFRRRRLDPYRIEIHLTTRAEVATRRIEGSRFGIGMFIGVVSAVAGVVGGVAAVLALH